MARSDQLRGMASQWKDVRVYMASQWEDVGVYMVSQWEDVGVYMVSQWEDVGVYMVSQWEDVGVYMVSKGKMQQLQTVSKLMKFALQKRSTGETGTMEADMMSLSTLWSTRRVILKEPSLPLHASSGHGTCISCITCHRYIYTRPHWTHTIIH